MSRLPTATFIDDAAKKKDTKWLQRRKEELRTAVADANRRIKDEQDLVKELQGEIEYIDHKLNWIE